MKKVVSWIVKGVLAALSALLWVLSLPKVRNFIWDRVIGKSREKVIDVKAKVVEGEEKKKKRGIFG